jgi:branched-chain amino acid transport system permease protein
MKDPRSKGIKLAMLTALVVILCLLPLFLGYYMLHIFILIFIYTIASVSLRTITISGQFPLAHAAFMGIGAYLAAMASRWLNWPVWITIPSASLATAGIGMLTGYPFARLRALYYAMGSLFLGIGVLNVIYAGGKVTGGYSGFTGIHPMFLASKTPYYYFFLALGLLSVIALYRFEFSRIGINLKAIDQSHMVASSVGINEVRYRVLVVGVGCFFAGLAGAGYAHYNLVLSSSTFDFLATLWLVMYVLIGGIKSSAGPIVGTFVLIFISELFRGLGMYSPFVPAALLALVVYLLPNGLVSLPGIVWSRLLNRDKKGTDHAS